MKLQASTHLHLCFASTWALFQGFLFSCLSPLLLSLPAASAESPPTCVQNLASLIFVILRVVFKCNVALDLDRKLIFIGTIVFLCLTCHLPLDLDRTVIFIGTIIQDVFLCFVNYTWMPKAWWRCHKFKL